MTHEEKMAYFNAIAKKKLGADRTMHMHLAVLAVEFAEDPRQSPAQARAYLKEMCDRYGLKVKV